MKKLSELELALKKIATVVQDRLSTKQNVLTAGTGITIALDGTISATGGVGGVQSDWNQNDSTANDFIKNKPTIPNLSLEISKSSVIEINELLDGTDNNIFLSSIGVNNHTITANLKNISELPIIASKEDKMVVVTKSSGTTLTADVGKYYRFTYSVGKLNIKLPTPTGSNVQSILFFLSTGASPNVTFTGTGDTITIIQNTGFAINASSTYEINALWNGSLWAISAVKYYNPVTLIIT